MTEYQRKMRRLRGRPLAQREAEVWKYLVQGLTSRETARKMKIAEQTVNSMRKIVYRKLGVHNLAGAIHKWYLQT